MVSNLHAGGVLIPNPDIVKVYDLVYSNQGGDWNDFARNWTLAKASFSNLIDELGFKVRHFFFATALVHVADASASFVTI